MHTQPHHSLVQLNGGGLSPTVSTSALELDARPSATSTDNASPNNSSGALPGPGKKMSAPGSLQPYVCMVCSCCISMMLSYITQQTVVNNSKGRSYSMRQPNSRRYVDQYAQKPKTSADAAVEGEGETESPESSNWAAHPSAPPPVEEKPLGSAHNPNRAEMPPTKRKGSYDPVRCFDKPTMMWYYLCV